ncbi:hypothetical protein AA313_de0203912 [Arthrobotrys entomopaga]|nr:hypothetical protein AA313_de0203912 [Arthrobotrys entomopaga]
MADILRRAADAESLISPAASRNDYATALDACIKAADLYLQAWKACSDPVEKQRQRDKFMQLLEKGEALKKLKLSSGQGASPSGNSTNTQSITKSVASISLTEGKVPGSE